MTVKNALKDLSHHSISIRFCGGEMKEEKGVIGDRNIRRTTALCVYSNLATIIRDSEYIDLNT